MAPIEVRAIPGFTIAEVRYEPRAYQARHEHEDTRLIVTLRGGFTETWERRRHTCGPASAMLRPAGEPHSNQYDARGAMCLNVRFAREWGICAGSNGAAEIGALAARLHREVREGDSASPIGIQCGVLDILSQFSSRPTRPRERQEPHWIEATKELLRSRLNSPPDVGEAAKLAGVHPAHLSRAFRQFTGTSMGCYLRRQRVEAACERLRQRRASLAEIALETGFYDQAHFSRVFRRQTGVSPKEFRSLYAS